MHAEVEAYFADALDDEIETIETIDKDQGRIETRRTSVSRNVDIRRSALSDEGAVKVLSKRRLRTIPCGK